MRAAVQSNKANSMVEAGILSALIVILSAIGTYVPALGFFLFILWPVPLIVLGVRHGFKWNLMALTVSALLLSILITPLSTIVLVGGWGFTGLVLGWCIKERKPLWTTMVYSTIVLTISTIFVFALNFFVLGVDPTVLIPQAIENSIETSTEIYRSMGMPEDVIKQNLQTLTQVIGFMKILLPSMIFLSSVSMSMLNIYVGRKLLKRLGTHLEDYGIPKFKEWVFPDTLLFFYGATLVVLFILRGQERSLLFAINANISIITSIPMIIQGLCVVWYIVEKKNWPGFLKGMTVALLFIQPFVQYGVLFIGMLDYSFDFRKIRPPRKKYQV